MKSMTRFTGLKYWPRFGGFTVQTRYVFILVVGLLIFLVDFFILPLFNIGLVGKHISWFIFVCFFKVIIV
jgi:hypothetical protein